MRQRIAFIISGWWVLAGLAGIVALVQAQTQTSEWAKPINLSQSGATADPFMVVDASGNFHVFWQDTYADVFMYSQGREDAWSPAINATLPFTGVVPLLVADANGRAHAFWIDSEDDFLLYSSAPITGLTTLENWSLVQTLADTAADVDVAIDATGQLHLLYLSPDETVEMPSGIYYRQTIDDGQAWSPPQPVYQSPYFRGLAREDANVELTTTTSGGRSWVFAAWDNRSLDKVFFTRSADDGQSWEPLQEIDGRDVQDDPTVVGPSRIRLSGEGANLMLLWEAGHEGHCTLFFQVSTDWGNTWQPRQSLLADRGACPERWQVMDDNGDSNELQLLLASFARQSFLLAWDGSYWSEPQAQPILDRFTDSSTNRRVDFQWQQGVTRANDLVVLGQDPEQNKDVWLLNRAIGTTLEWFPPTSLWSVATPVFYSRTDINDLDMASDKDGMVHVIWTQDDETDSAHSAIYYLMWNGEQWTFPLQILQTPGGERAEQPSMTVTDDGRILVVWRSESGTLLFSQATSDKARIPTEWSQIQPLPTLTSSVGKPMIAVDGNGRIYVTYTLKLNEKRGVYYIYSDDNGFTWSDPVQLFDAVSAGWDMLDNAQLMFTNNGMLQAVWTKYSLPPQTTPQGVYYSFSPGHDQPWSAPVSITNVQTQWSSLIGNGEEVHRLWMQVSEGDSLVWHDYSLDGGQTFTNTQRVPGLEDHVGPVDVTIDRAGQLHLLLADREQLSYRLWNGTRWVEMDGLPLKDKVSEERLTVGVALTANNVLMGLFSGETPEPATGEMAIGVYATQYDVLLPDEMPTPLPALTVTPPPSPTATAVSSAPPTPTSPVLTDFDQSQPTSNATILDDDIARLALSVLPALALIILIFAIGMGIRWSRR